MDSHESLGIETAIANDPMIKCVSMRIQGQLFGVPVKHVRDVLSQCKIESIPLAPKEVAGVLNLRGRIVTALDIRYVLELEPLASNASVMSVMIEVDGELFCIQVDEVGEVMRILKDRVGRTPENLDMGWQDIAQGIVQMENELLIIVDAERLLQIIAGRCWEIGAKK